MAATRALFRKEIEQHTPALLGTTGLLALAYAVLRLSFSRDARTLSVLELVSAFASWALPAAALFVGHRLVVAENYGRTQRFVEALPVRRGHMALVKAAYGLAWLWLWAAAVLVASVVDASERQPIDARFFTIMLLRLAGHVVALWGVVFLLGFFGRLRVLLACVLVATVWLLDRHTGWQLDRFGPFALVARETFPFERRLLPLRPLIESFAIGAAAVGAALALSRVREGSLVETLSRPLGPRELAALFVVAAGAALGFTATSADTNALPYAITSDQMVAGKQSPLQLAYLEPGLRPAAERLVRTLDPLLASFARDLGWPRVPPVRLIHGPETAPARPVTVYLHPEHGITMRVNLLAITETPPPLLVAHVLHQLGWAHTRGRAGFEPRHFVLDGFTLHLALDGHDRRPWELSAVAATTLVAVDERAIAAHHSTSERLGDDVTQALAASGWRVLTEQAGRDRALALARAVLSRQGTGDVRDVIETWRNPWPTLFARQTGLRWDDFVARWAADLARRRADPAVAAALRALPRATLSVTSAGAEPLLTGSFTVPPAEGTPCTLLEHALPPYDYPLDRDDLEEDSFLFTEKDRTFARRLAGSYGSGGRAFVALDCEVPGLVGAFRVHADRVTVP